MAMGMGMAMAMAMISLRLSNTVQLVSRVLYLWVPLLARFVVSQNCSVLVDLMRHPLIATLSHLQWEINLKRMTWYKNAFLIQYPPSSRIILTIKPYCVQASFSSLGPARYASSIIRGKSANFR